MTNTPFKEYRYDPEFRYYEFTLDGMSWFEVPEVDVYADKDYWGQVCQKVW